MADVFLQFEDGSVEGPFDSPETAEDWVLDLGGVTDKYKVVTESELSTSRGEGFLVEVKVRVRFVSDQNEAEMAVARALDAYNGEAFASGVLELVN